MNDKTSKHRYFLGARSILIIFTVLFVIAAGQKKIWIAIGRIPGCASFCRLSPVHRVDFYRSGSLKCIVELGKRNGTLMEYGQFRYWWPNGKPRVFTYCSGGSGGSFTARGAPYGFPFEGKFRSWYKNGEESKNGVYIDGKRDGEWNQWYPNGQLKHSGIYSNGVRGGLWLSYHPNGDLRGSNFVVLVGRGREVLTYENGVTNIVCETLDGEISKVYKWNSNGTLISVRTYGEGKSWSSIEIGDPPTPKGYGGHSKDKSSE